MTCQHPRSAAADAPVRGRRPDVRRLIVGATLLAGVTTLALTLRLEPGNDTFVIGALSLAAIWAVGARACGPLPMRGPTALGRQAGTALLVGSAPLVLCLAVGVVVSGVPVLAEPAADLLAHRGTAVLPLVVVITALNGVAEELYFRGALYDAVPVRSAWLLTAVAYALATLPSGVLLLSAAAALLGVLTGLLRRATGGLLAPIVAHLVWSLGMLLLLPFVLVPGR